MAQRKDPWVHIVENRRKRKLDRYTLRWVATQLIAADAFLKKKARTQAHAYICAYSWGMGYRALAESRRKR